LLFEFIKRTFCRFINFVQSQYTIAVHILMIFHSNSQKKYLRKKSILIFYYSRFWFRTMSKEGWRGEKRDKNVIQMSEKDLILNFFYSLSIFNFIIWFKFHKIFQTSDCNHQSRNRSKKCSSQFNPQKKSQNEWNEGRKNWVMKDCLSIVIICRNIERWMIDSFEIRMRSGWIVIAFFCLFQRQHCVIVKFFHFRVHSRTQ
jgi:hypothetical protein